MAIRPGPANHIEMVHRPGDGAAAARLLGLLGFAMTALPTAFAGVSWQMTADRVLWLSEVTAEQWAFERWLADRLAHDGTAASRAYVAGHVAHPQTFPHFGVGMATLAEWEATVARLRDAAAGDPLLAGRIELPAVKRPGDDGSVAHATGGRAGGTLYQAFLRTDLFSSGLLTLGQAIEVQHYRENDPDWSEA